MREVNLSSAPSSAPSHCGNCSHTPRDIPTIDIWNENTGRYEKQANLPGLITCKDDALKTPLAFDPGERWEYGINIDFAGKMVEKVSGQRLEGYFHDHVFGPLGMADTSFKLSPSQRERLVAMHARDADGSLKPIEFEMPQEPEFFMGGGGLYSTGPDYLKFVRMFLNKGSLDGKTLLRPETVAMMGQNQIGDANVAVLKTVMPDTRSTPNSSLAWSRNGASAS